jgi:hypothetical protein
MRGEAVGWVYLMDAQDLAQDLSYSLRSLRDKNKRGCYSRIRPEGGGGAGVVSGMVWWCFK